MSLKPQDLYVALKLVAMPSRPLAGSSRARSPRDDRRIGRSLPPLSYAHLALELVMSPSEVHACVNRATLSGLLHRLEGSYRPNITALQEFLLHGLKYAFPPERGELTRGIPTSYGAPPLLDAINPGTDPIPVWPYPAGSSRGISFAPLYKSAPAAALRDPDFHVLLTLADALRDGRVRERKLAEKEIRERLRKART